jgi:hypothetical protein
MKVDTKQYITKRYVSKHTYVIKRYSGSKHYVVQDCTLLNGMCSYEMIHVTKRYTVTKWYVKEQ